MKRKWLAIGIILLFVGTSIIPAMAQHIETSNQPCRGTTITVDDDGDGDYTSIKDAVNHSNPGDTIEVYSVNYFENRIKITKDNITLIGISHELGSGNDSGKPFINGNGTHHVIQVCSSHVIVSNLSIENPWSGPLFVYCIYIGTGVMNNQNNITVTGCKISNTSHSAIYDEYHKDIKIINNEIHYCSDYAILMGSGIVTGNLITDSSTGIYFMGSQQKVTGNIIKRCGLGIKLQGYKNIVAGNDIDNCSVSFYDWGSGGNTITKNNFKNYSQSGYWWDRYLGTLILWGVRKNIWIGNYWDTWDGIGPKKILGYLILWIPVFIEVIEYPIPWFCFDWHPAPEPYDILGMR